MIYFTPGPSQLYPTVPGHLETAFRNGVLSISHRGEEFKEIYATTELNLRMLLNIPESHRLLFLSSATEAMERIILNCVNRASFHLINGAFSQRFFSIAEQLNKKAKRHTSAFGAGFIANEVTVPVEAELICVTHNETSTGVAIPTAEIYALHRRCPDALLVVDIVSSVPCVELDYSCIDAAFFSVQKGFGLPAGLGVLIVNERCLEKARRLRAAGQVIGSYHSLLALADKAKNHQNPETPNVLGIYLLKKVCADLLERGLGTVQSEIGEKAALIYQYFEESPGLAPFVKQAGLRSQTIAVAETQPQSVDFVKLAASAGFSIGRGYSRFKDSQIRIANYPAHSVEAVKKLINCLHPG
ncbi:MAG: aminotransferase class V-fold PLP-dependent enzyme [Candidatus Marinimicrobia bacterium]|nr:aminotransferase class V-fold PLP-dependent enzyme [Candidatus Neomarinimicrobiota bacterium]